MGCPMIGDGNNTALMIAEGKHPAASAGYAVIEVPESVAVHVHRLEGEILRLRTALQMIAGQKQCLDGTMCNVDIAKAALEYKA